jgi:hypothetical protein
VWVQLKKSDFFFLVAHCTILYCNCVEPGATFNLLCLFSACLILSNHAEKQLLLNSPDFKVTNVKKYETLDGVKFFY